MPVSLSSSEIMSVSGNLSKITPSNLNEESALKTAIRVLDCVASNPQLMGALLADLQNELLSEAQEKREKMIKVIFFRLQKTNKSVLREFAEGRANQKLIKAWIAMNHATSEAISLPRPENHEALETREEASLARMKAFDRAEAHIASVRQALKSPLKVNFMTNAQMMAAGELLQHNTSVSDQFDSWKIVDAAPSQSKTLKRSASMR